MKESLQEQVTKAREYWDAHPLGIQYVTDSNISIGTREFFDHIRPWMNPYKFPWIMDRIEREAAKLHKGRLLEIGCGLGYDSLEFLKRGVGVTATDLTPTAVNLTKMHFEMEGVRADDVRMENVLELSFEDNSFDAVWANGVLHATGDTPRAIQQIHRVLRPGGRAIISHFYRRPSWIYLITKWGKINIEHEDQDPPVNDFCTENEILSMFQGFKIEDAVQEHYRALPICRSGLKAGIYRTVFRPVYNLLPESIAKRLAYKFSITALKL